MVAKSKNSITLKGKLKILGQEFDIVLDKINRDGSYGCCMFEHGEIIIYVDETVKSYQGYDVMDTLCHEIAHAALERSGLTHNSNSLISNALDETLCTQLGRVFAENIHTIATINEVIKGMDKKRKIKKKDKPTKVVNQKEQTDKKDI